VGRAREVAPAEAVTAIRPHHPIETWFFVRESGVADTDQNVLTGGPVTGIRIKNLPAAVKKVLKAEAPTAEVADISTRTRDGRLIYRIVFSEPARNPMLYIAEDGTIVENLND
jgi:hypothetical protein